MNMSIHKKRLNIHKSDHTEKKITQKKRYTNSTIVHRLVTNRSFSCVPVRFTEAASQSVAFNFRTIFACTQFAFSTSTTAAPATASEWLTPSRAMNGERRTINPTVRIDHPNARASKRLRPPHRCTSMTNKQAHAYIYYTYAHAKQQQHQQSHHRSTKCARRNRRPGDKEDVACMAVVYLHATRCV